MISAIAAAYMFFLFAVWGRSNWIDVSVKVFSLGLGLALSFEAAVQFGFIIQLNQE